MTLVDRSIKPRHTIGPSDSSTVGERKRERDRDGESQKTRKERSTDGSVLRNSMHNSRALRSLLSHALSFSLATRETFLAKLTFGRLKYPGVVPEVLRFYVLVLAIEIDLADHIRDGYEEVHRTFETSI